MKNTNKFTRRLLFVLLFFSMVSFGQKKLTPQEIEYDGMPELEYKINSKIIALDASSGLIRMKFNGKEVTMKMNKSKTILDGFVGFIYCRLFITTNKHCEFW